MEFDIRISSKYILPISAFLSFQICQGQINKPVYEIGLHAGSMVYQGDLTPSALGSFQTARFSKGLSLARVISTSLSIRGNIEFGALAGNDGVYSKPAYRQQRNFNFSTSVREFTAQLVWHFPGVAVNEKGFTTYAFAGGGLSLLRITPDASRFNPEFFGTEAPQIQEGLAADAAHGTPGLLPVLIAGAGLKYFFKPQWAVNAEASYRLIYSDYLDGFSQSVNPALNDHYMNYSVGIIYRTGRKGSALDCPKVIN